MPTAQEVLDSMTWKELLEIMRDEARHVLISEGLVTVPSDFVTIGGTDPD